MFDIAMLIFWFVGICIGAARWKRAEDFRKYEQARLLYSQQRMRDIRNGRI